MSSWSDRQSSTVQRRVGLARARSSGTFHRICTLGATRLTLPRATLHSFIKRVEVKAEKLFRILLLAVLYTPAQISNSRAQHGTQRTNKFLSCLFFIALYMYIGSNESTAALLSFLASSSSFNFPPVAASAVVSERAPPVTQIPQQISPWHPPVVSRHHQFPDPLLHFAPSDCPVP
jgi:hypothetical protein